MMSVMEALTLKFQFPSSSLQCLTLDIPTLGRNAMAKKKEKGNDDPG
jgi:hypothetical protein